MWGIENSFGHPFLMVPTYLVEHVALLGCVVVDWLAHIGVQLLWLVVRHNDVLEESRGRIMVGGLPRHR